MTRFKKYRKKLELLSKRDVIGRTLERFYYLILFENVLARRHGTPLSSARAPGSHFM